MKYIEELQNGQIFVYNTIFYVLSNDFKIKNNLAYHMCIAISNGGIHWLEANTIVEIVPLFYQDENNLLHSMDKQNEKNT